MRTPPPGPARARGNGEIDMDRNGEKRSQRQTRGGLDTGDEMSCELAGERGYEWLNALTLNWKLRTGGSLRMLKRLLAYVEWRHDESGYGEAQKRWTYMRGFATLLTAVLVRAEFLRMCEPDVTNDSNY